MRWPARMLYVPWLGRMHVPVRAGRAALRARMNMGRSLARDITVTGRAANLKGRTGWALLGRYIIGEDTIGSRGFIAAVTRTAGPRSFGGAKKKKKRRIRCEHWTTTIGLCRLNPCIDLKQPAMLVSLIQSQS